MSRMWRGGLTMIRSYHARVLFGIEKHQRRRRKDEHNKTGITSSVRRKLLTVRVESKKRTRRVLWKGDKEKTVDGRHAPVLEHSFGSCKFYHFSVSTTTIQNYNDGIYQFTTCVRCIDTFRLS